MRDYDDRVTFFLHLSQDIEELGRLLYRKNRGRLVKDDRLGTVVEHLYDLESLLFAD